MALSKLDSTAFGTLSGNLSFASGQGIDFGATADGGGIATQSELFDNYEEGRWTPTIEGATTVGTVTLGSQYGSYTVIGNTCTVRGYITWSSHTGSGTMYLKGMPYDIAVQNSYEYLSTGSCMATNIDWNDNYTQFTPYAASGAQIQFYVSQDNAAWSSVNVTATGGLIFTVSYPIA